MSAPFRPSWLVGKRYGPDDTSSMSMLDFVQGHADVRRDPNGVDVDILCMVGHQLSRDDNPPEIDKALGIRYLRLAVSRRNPSAHYLLGLRLEMEPDFSEAARLYRDGFELSGSSHIDCAYGMYSIASKDGGASLAAAEALLVSLSVRPDLLALAKTWGSRCSRDLLWEVRALRRRSHHGGAAVEAARLLDLCIALDDAHAMLTKASELLGGESADGTAVSMSAAREGVDLCERILKLPKCSSSSQNYQLKASCYIGCTFSLRSQYDDARRAFDKAFTFGGSSANEFTLRATTSYREMLALGLGGPVDKARAMEVVQSGVKMLHGPCLEVAARMKAEEGFPIEASNHLRRAAILRMPEAMAIVHGVTVREAKARIPFFCRLANAAGGGAGSNSAGSATGAGDDGHLTKASDAVAFGFACCACGAPGRIGTDLDAALAISKTALLSTLADAHGDMAGASELSHAALAERVLVAEAAEFPPKASLVVFEACGRCRRALYCNVTCQTAHWPKHKCVCRGMEVKPKKAGGAQMVKRL